jgi:hypothetical protein
MPKNAIELDALEDRLLPQSTPTIVVLGLGDPAHVSNLTPPGKGHASWTAPNLRSAVVNAAQTGSNTDTIVLPSGTIDLSQGPLEVASGLDLTIEAATGTARIDAHLRSRVLLVDAGGAVTAQDLIFDRGSASASGGAIVNDGTLTLLGSRVVNSQVTGAKGLSAVYGGGIDNEGVLTIRNGVVADNSVVGASASGGESQQVYGGGVYNNGTLTISNSTFSGNQLRGGDEGVPGGAFLQGGNAYGGAIAFAANASGSVSVRASTFNNNQAVGGNITAAASQAFGGFALGGAVFQDPNNTQDLTFVNCTFAFNNVQGGTARATDNEVLGGGAQGGALDLTTHASLINDTVAFNSAAGGRSSAGVNPVQGGGIYSFTAGQPGATGTRIWNTLVAGNTVNPSPNTTPSGTVPDDVDGVFASQGHNLIGTAGSASGFSAALHDIFATSGRPPIGPKLDTVLRSNGGPTQTLALLAGSPAIDRGDNGALASPPGVTTDQRGVSRPQGPAVDIGSFEYVPPPTPWPVLATGTTWLNKGNGPQQLVIHSARDLSADTGLSELQLAAILHVASVDWATQMIVLVSVGTSRPPSPTVAITGLTLKNNTLTVEWELGTRRAAPPLPMPLTDPAALVLVNRFDGSVQFHQDGQ